MYSLLAWRNIWRNPRRTFVILTAVVIGVWSMIILGALMRGMETEMVRNGISTLTGSIQIHNTLYGDDPVVENSMTDITSIGNVLDQTLPENSVWTKRIRVGAIASNARHSGGITLVGIEPEKEASVSFIGNAVVEGDYLTDTASNSIIVGNALLKKFETRIGNKLILMSQDTGQEIASQAFRITGVFRADLESVEKQYVFVHISQAATMLKLGDAVSEISVMLPELDIHGHTETAIAEDITRRLDDGTVIVESWRDLLPMMKAYLDMTDFFLYIWYVVVFIAMGFGIVNTTLMAIFERMREFGLMKAFGMRPFQIIRGVVTETLFLLITGIAVGLLTGLLSVAALSQKGIDLSALAAGVEMWGMPRVLYPEIWIQDLAVAGGVVLILGITVSLYPAFKAAGFTPVEAMSKH